MHIVHGDTRLVRSDTEIREDAWREYEAARAGIEKYDEHLYRIRQWNIALTAASIAAILGLAQTGNFRPSLALFGYTAICFVFWSLDAMNKSLQMVHIHVSRDIERYLRGESNIYIGPAISLRFNRKSKRHLIETIKNLTDQSLFLFYAMPLCVLWSVVMVSGWSKLCFRLSCELPAERLVTIISVSALFIILCLSWLWKNGRQGGRPYCWNRYFLRCHAAERWRWRTVINTEIEGSTDKETGEEIKADATPWIAKDVRICPFNIDYMNTKTGVVLMVDRYPLSQNRDYIEERQRCLERFNLLVLHIDWTPPRWQKPWVAAVPVIDDKNQGRIDRLREMGDPYPGYSPENLGLILPTAA